MRSCPQSIPRSIQPYLRFFCDSRRAYCADCAATAGGHLNQLLSSYIIQQGRVMTDKHLFLCPSDELYRKPARGYDRFGARTRARAWCARSAADRGIIPAGAGPNLPGCDRSRISQLYCSRFFPGRGVDAMRRSLTAMRRLMMHEAQECGRGAGRRQERSRLPRSIWSCGHCEHPFPFDRRTLPQCLP